MKRIMIGAVKSGSGKTTITCGLLQCIKDRGMAPHSFKCGPDYIDPMFHETVLKIPAGNLDTFFSTKEEVQALFAKELKASEIAVAEGVMGLYDGLGGIREEGSSYHLAECLDMPILLVVDGHGMGKSMLAVIAGFLQYDRKKLIRGVILNRVSKSFGDTISPLIREKLGVPVLGCIPKDEKMTVPGRHLGLCTPLGRESEGLQEQLSYIGKVIEQHTDMERILQIASAASNEVDWTKRKQEYWKQVTCNREELGHAYPENRKIRIGIARDEAFCFYYQENLHMLEMLGAELAFFSPLHDACLPANLHGLYLGGGYPELYAGQLSENRSMRRAVKEAIEGKMPTVAECGGFMYLHETIRTVEGDCFPLAGVIGGECHYTGKLVRFGYIELRKNQEKKAPLDHQKTSFLDGKMPIRGHEFHYFDSTDNGKDCVARKPVTGREYTCVHMGETFFWGFPHLYYPSCPGFAAHFVNQCLCFQQKKDIIAQCK